ncbi:MAG: hypothetical protein KC503_17630 [Myxococcales bacterium]|nr:hypothetical protein [Myxococcales bacterium]
MTPMLKYLSGENGIFWSRVTIGVELLVYLVFVVLLALALRSRNDKISAGPAFVCGVLALLGLYVLGSTIDAVALLVRDEARGALGSFVERMTLGRIEALRALMPLDKHPLVAAPIYVGIACLLHVLLTPLCYWLGRFSRLEPMDSDDDRKRARFDAIFYAASRSAAMWRRFFDLCGYGDLRTIEPRFLSWLRPMLVVLPLLLLLSFFELSAKTQALSGFVWGACVVFVISAWANWLLSRPALKKGSEAEAQPEASTPGDALAWLEALRARGFAVSATPARTVSPRAAVVARRGTRKSSALEDELRGVLIGEAEPLWAHQSEAVARVLHSREHVLLATPPRSGKSVTASLLAARVALARGKNVLFVLRDEPTAAEGRARMQEALAHTSWAQNLRCTQAGAELRALLAQRRSPVLTFCHPDALSAILANHDDYAYFLEHLGLVVVEDIERYSGARAPSVAFVMRRLAAVLASLGSDIGAGATAGEPKLEADGPRVLATLGLPARDLERYAETLLGVDLSLVAGDAAPTVTIKLHPAREPRADDESLPAAALAAAEATALELPMSMVGFANVTRSELDRAAGKVTRSRGRVETVAPELSRVSVAELSGPQLSRLVATLYHIGSRFNVARALVEGDEDAGEGRAAPKLESEAPPEEDDDAADKADEKPEPKPPDEHHQLILPAADPISRWLASDLGRALELADRGRALVAELGSRMLARQHALQCLAEQPADGDWLEQRFGRAVIAELASEGLIRWRTVWRLQGEPPRLARGREVRLAGAAPPFRAHSQTVHAEPVLVVDRATGAVVRRLDPERAPLVAYPGAVLLYRGRRFSVPDEEIPRYRAGDRIAVDLCEDDLHSVRVRKLAVNIEDADALRELSLGGEQVLGGLARVVAIERIVGSRRHRRDGTLSSVSTFAPIETRVRGEARVLCVPRDGGEPAVHALVHLLRAALGVLLDCGEEGLVVAHTVDLAGRGPALLLLDTFPGGVGYARAADVKVQKAALTLCAALLDSTFAKADDAAVEAVARVAQCHDLSPSRAQLDVGGARVLLRRLLLPPSPDAPPGERSETPEQPLEGGVQARAEASGDQLLGERGAVA